MNEKAGYKSKNLFSSHYLEKLIQKTSEWREDEKNEQAFSRIKDIYTKKKDYLHKLSEPDLEREFIRPMLDVLGHHFAVQEKVHKKARRPDYAFFPNGQIKQESLKNLGKEDFYRQAVAIGDAKKWELPLDKDIKGKAIFENKNPSFQINTYLRETPPKWAILTNGRFWRIYYQDTSYKLDSYYEVDLVDLLEKGNIENFKYFYLFFRLEAFLEDASGKTFLDGVFQGSIEYAKGLGESLQNNIYEALKILAEGFLIWPKNNLKLDERTIEIVHDNCLILLYRLIFILYAESRELLDTGNPIYNKTYSLNGLKKEVAEKSNRGEKFFTWSDEYWHRLKSLFALINEGSEARKIPKQELFIPSYNGGLFDPKRNEFLSETSIGDHYLTKVIDLLSRSNGSFVDYSTLDIRHIGSIYEGLLEYKLNIATQDLVAIKEKGKEKWIPKIEANGKKIYDKVKEGGLYLTTDKGERKATGSYYTPEYIVKYIVKNTLEPILEEKLKKARENGEKEGDAILSVKVLDPAMGSGHFLVESVDFLTTPFLDAVSHDVEKGLLPEEEYSTDWAKREIVSHCIYGVDLNPLSVELAKLSLWLKTIAKDKPLSFLDHRLKCGNSLIGVKLIDLPWYPKKKTDKRVQKVDLEGHKPFIKKLLETTRKLEEIRDDTLEQVKEKERIFEELKNTPEYIKIKTLADVNISLYFGNEIPGNGGKLAERRYGDFANWVYFGNPSDWENAKKLSWVKCARETANEKRFFHWELEFPEVFYEAGKEKENPGFDVVVGNPPYYNLETSPINFRDYLKNEKNWREFYRGKADIHYYFSKKGIDNLKLSGRFGFITSRYWIEAREADNLRRYLLHNSIPQILIDFRDLKVFEDPSIHTSILICTKEKKIEKNNIIKYKYKGNFGSAYALVQSEKYIEKSINELSDDKWYFLEDKEDSIVKKIEKNNDDLGDIFDIGQGMMTGLNEAFVVTRQEAKNIESNLIKNFIKNSDIPAPYSLLKRDELLIYPENIEDIDIYPKLKNHLLKFEKKLKERALVKKGTREWYKYQNPINKELFESAHEKIVVPYRAPENRFALDTNQVFNESGDIRILVFKKKPKEGIRYFLVLLNSTLLNFFNSKTGKKKGEVFEYFGNMSTYPIQRIIFETPKKRRREYVGQLKELYKHYLQGGKIDTILQQVDLHLFAEPDESDAVHDFLVFLAEQMIEMNKEKHKEIQNFIEWLQREIKAEIDQLTNRTKLKAYYDLKFDEFLEILRKNKKKIPINLSNREFQTNLKREFDTSISKLNPLKEKIECIDNLIDQIVYKLYGLTDKEIEIVGSSLSKESKGRGDEK